MRATSGARTVSEPRLLKALLAILVLALAFAPLAVGSVHEWSRGVVFALSALALFVALLRRRSVCEPALVTVPLVALAVIVVATALQLVPLPAAVLAWLSPAGHELLSLRSYRIHSLSLEPAATVSELAKLGAYLAFFAAASIYASRTPRRRHLILAVASVATVAAVIGIAQAALGMKEILGIYKPQAEWGYLVRGTFVNPNHFGALMCLGGPCAIVVALRDRRLRSWAFAASFVIAVAAVLTTKRATMASLVVGYVLAFGLDFLQLRRGTEILRSRALVRGTLALAIAAAAIVAIGFGRGRLEPEIDRTVSLRDLGDPLSKIAVWRRSADLVWSYPWTGVGRGAFPQAFARVSDMGGYAEYQWAENAYIQAPVDWGVPVALLLALLGGVSVVLAARRLGEDPLMLGPFASVIAFAVHEAADFAVELPGVALPALALLACLFGRPSSASSPSSSSPSSSLGPAPATRPLTVRRAYLALPLLLFLPFVAELVVPTAAEDAAALTRLARDPAVPIDRVIEFGDAARVRHPADYYICSLVADRLARELHPQSMRWLNEAMYLNPTHWAPHLMAAEVLAASGKKVQALLEYRLAAAGAPNPRLAVWDRVRARYPALDDLLAATPDQTLYLATLAKWLLNQGRTADAERVYQLVVDREPGHPRARATLAQIAISRGDAVAAHAHVQALLQVDFGPAAQHLQIEELMLLGDLRGAVTLLDKGRQPPRERFDLDLVLSQALARAGHTDEARARLDRLLSWEASPDARIRLFDARANVERSAGNDEQVRWELEQRERVRRK